MDTATQRGEALAPHMLGDLSGPTRAGHGRQIDLETVFGCLFRRIRSVVPTNSITPGRRLREQPTRGVAYPSMITSFSVVGE